VVESPEDIAAETVDYVRELQGIALGHDPDANVKDRLAALKLLLDLKDQGVTSAFLEQPEKPDPYEGDPEIEALREQLKDASREGYIARLERDIELRRFG